jgi:hypothetical protein
MFYGKDSIENQFTPLIKKMEETGQFIFEPMPSYKNGDRWTDEFRVRDGHTKLADGSWVTIHKAHEFLKGIQKSTTDLYEQYQETLSQLNLVRQQKREMEFGLRTAQKSLNNALAMKGDSDE